MSGKYRALLEESLDSMQLPMQEEQLDQLQDYIAELELFNPVYKLVGAEGEQLVIRHILDSLSGATTIAKLANKIENCSIADLGSGAGLPGIPLAIAMGDYPFSLIERMGRRVAFLRNALLRTRLSNRVQIIDCDLKEVKQQFDLITFRAFHPLADILDLVSTVLKDEGMVCAYKAGLAQVESELLQVENVCKSKWKAEFVELSVPHLDAQRSLCLLQKI